MKIKPILRYYIQISEMNFEYNVTYVYWEILAVLNGGAPTPAGTSMLTIWKNCTHMKWS